MSDARVNEISTTTVPAVATPHPVGPSAVQLAVVVAIVAAGLLLTAFTSDVTRVSEAGIKLVNGQPFLVEQAGDWRGGTLEGLSEAERRILPADTEGARRTYVDEDGNKVFCSAVLAGRDVTSIHRPELCLSGQGWRNQGKQMESIGTAAAPGGMLQVTRLTEVLDVTLPDGRVAQSRSIYAYWFVGKDRLTSHHWQRILWTSEDRVLHNTNHRWAYLLVGVPVETKNASDLTRAEQQAWKRLENFIQSVYPTLVSR